MASIQDVVPGSEWLTPVRFGDSARWRVIELLTARYHYPIDDTTVAVLGEYLDGPEKVSIGKQFQWHIDVTDWTLAEDPFVEWVHSVREGVSAGNRVDPV